MCERIERVEEKDMEEHPSAVNVWCGRTLSVPGEKGESGPSVASPGVDRAGRRAAVALEEPEVTPLYGNEKLEGDCASGVTRSGVQHHM
ncbi:unnamed protein product [Boreogadus saida]